MSAIESLAEATEFYVNSPEHFAPLPRPSQPAHIITSDAEAISVAERLAQQFAPGAARRDRDGILPVAELDAFSQSGLWGINIPREYGGAGVSYATVAKVIAIISAADSALGQIPQNHLAGVAHLLEDGTESQKQTLLAGVLSGLRWGNAFSEKGTATVADFKTTVRQHNGELVVNGEKFYATGALLAHLVHTVAIDEEGRANLVVLDRDAAGLTVINNWSSFGQRTTASGTVLLDNVHAPQERLIPVWQAFERPTAAGPISQIIQDRHRTRHAGRYAGVCAREITPVDRQRPGARQRRSVHHCSHRRPANPSACRRSAAVARRRADRCCYHHTQ